MAKISYNTKNLEFPRSSHIVKLTYNTGDVNIGSDSEMNELSYNCGHIHIGKNSVINTIKYNCGDVYLGEQCKVDKILYNTGNINAKRGGSTIQTVKFNTGKIKIDKDNGQFADSVPDGKPTQIPTKKPSQNFTRKEFNNCNSDEALDGKSALQAPIFQQGKSGLSLTIKKAGGVTSIKINTKSPTKQTRTSTTCTGDQPGVVIQVSKGEKANKKQKRRGKKDKNLPDGFTDIGVPPLLQVVPQTEATFDIQAHGILNVTSIEKSNGEEIKIINTKVKDSLSKEKVITLVDKAEEYKLGDEKEKARVSGKNSLESFCINIKRVVEDVALKDIIHEIDRKIVMYKCNDIIEWLDVNRLAEKKEFEDKEKELQKVCNPIISKIYAAGVITLGVPGSVGFLCPPDGTPVEDTSTVGASSTVKKID